MFLFDFPLLSEIIRYSFGSMILGVILTLSFVFLLFFIIRGFFPKSTFSPLSLFTGAVLVILLIPQMITLCGAVALKSMTGDVAQWLDQNLIHSNEYAVPAAISTMQSTEIVDVLIHRFPLVDYFVGSGVFEGYDTSNICMAIADELNSHLNKYILEALGWSLLYLMAGAFVVVWTIRRSQTCSGRAYSRHQRARSTTRATAPRYGRSNRRVNTSF